MKVWTFDYDPKTGTACPIPVTCETFGYPNKDSRGQTMYENTHFRTVDDAWAALLANANGHEDSIARNYREAQSQLERVTDALAEVAAFASEARTAYAEYQRNAAEAEGNPRDHHCDDYADSPDADPVARAFINHARSPGHGHFNPKPWPKLFADYEGARVRVVMASRMGDLGITSSLDVEDGYERRVFISQLTNFSETP